MKKTFAAIAVAALFLFATSTMAAGVKVPKSFCLDVLENNIEVNLITKASGSIKTSGNQTVKFYSIQGNLIQGPSIASAPVDGSGYLDGNIFHFTFDGILFFRPNAVRFAAEAYFDVVLGTGFMYFTQVLLGGTPFQENWTFQTQPCSDITIPFGEPTSVPEAFSSMIGD